MIRITKIVCALLAANVCVASVPGAQGAPRSGTTRRVPELPREYLTTKLTVGAGRRVAVSSRDNLQRAIDRAQPGDVLLLEPGATYRGPFRLPVKKGDAWITIRTAAADSALPPEGTRITPANQGLLPRLVTPGGNQSVITTAPGASQYRLIGLEITADSSVTQLNALVRFGNTGDEQRTLASIPSNLILDRSWVHGHSRLQLQRCVMLNSARSAIIDSYLSECHARGMDSQAIVAWNGPGPFKIVNNYLEGAGENVLFGGADPSVPMVTPGDIEFRGNHVTKPLPWRGVWTVKNLFEIKRAERVLVEGNIFENNWPDGQTGMAILVKSSQEEGAATWSQSRDITFRYNVVRQSAGGVTLAANPDPYPAVPAERILFEHNILAGIGALGGSQNGRMFLLLGGLKDVGILHNTMVHDGAVGLALIMDAPQGADYFDFVDNVATSGGEYGPMHGTARQGTAALAAFATHVTFTRNVFLGGDPSYVSIYPPQNRFLPRRESAAFATTALGPFALSSSSPLRSYWPGVLPGADVGRLSRKVQGVVPGTRAEP